MNLETMQRFATIEDLTQTNVRIDDIRDSITDITYETRNNTEELRSIAASVAFDEGYMKSFIRDQVMDTLRRLDILDENYEFHPHAPVQISDEAFFKLLEGDA